VNLLMGACAKQTKIDDGASTSAVDWALPFLFNPDSADVR